MFADALQWDLTLRMLADIGFDLDAGRQDRSAHPFTTTIALHDVRLTTRMDETTRSRGLSATIHEAGHGLYDQGFDPEYEDTPIAQAAVARPARVAVAAVGEPRRPQPAVLAPLLRP